MSISFLAPLQATPSVGFSSQPAAAAWSQPQTVTEPVQTSVTVRTNVSREQPQVPSPDNDRLHKYGMKNSRAPRPSYSEEQKFYIMYLRIVRSKSWPEIEDAFAQAFGEDSATRSKGGLTSVYYRIRKSWGLKDVLRTGPDALAEDMQEVDRRARNFSRDYLTAIRYDGTGLPRGGASLGVGSYSRRVGAFSYAQCEIDVFRVQGPMQGPHPLRTGVSLSMVTVLETSDWFAVEGFELKC